METVSVRVTLDFKVPVPTVQHDAVDAELAEMFKKHIEHALLGQDYNPARSDATFNVSVTTSVSSSKVPATRPPVAGRVNGTVDDDEHMECNEAPLYDSVDEGVFVLFARNEAQ